MTALHDRRMLKASLLATTMLVAPQLARAEVNTLIDGNNGTLPLPTGQFVTPTAPLTNAVQQDLNPGLPAYPKFVAGEAVRSQLSPDGTTLAIICAGQNTLYDTTGKLDTANSTQYIFLYDVAGGNKTSPALMQVIKQTNAHVGLVWSPDGSTLYGTGGNDDAVYAYTKTNGTWSQSAKIPLGHIPGGATATNLTAGVGVGLGVEPNASGLGISAEGKTLVVANNFNDSISVIDTATNTVRYEHDLRPYSASNEGTSGVAGGEYPLAVVIKGTTAYVSSNRDREVVAVDISSPTAARLITRIKLDGNANGMTLNAAQTTLYVAQDNADEVAVIDTTSNKVAGEIDTRAPAGMLTGPHYTGASPFAVTISPDGKTLYAVNDGSNCIAVIPLTGSGANTVTGLIPTAYAPKDITFSADGTWMYIINGKSDTGPNPGHLTGSTALITNITYPGGNAAAAAAASASNQYQFQLEHATLVSAQVPGSPDLSDLTTQVAKNNLYSVPANTGDAAVMNFLHGKIQHIIYIVKENRTFDQILGDLNNGANGDPSLTQFGRRITPNFHRLATDFVTLDNFMDPSDGSMDGWSWTMRGRVTTTEEITQQINYAGVDRGLSYEGEGSNRNVPVGLATAAARDAATKGAFTGGAANLPGGAPNLLPGSADVAGTDAPFGTQEGYIFDSVLNAGLTVRNYGWQVNNIGPTTSSNGNPITNAGDAGVVQAAEVNSMLVPLTDVYFRGFDQTYSDQWDVNEWNREFMQYIANKNLPSLETVRLSHDHMGSFTTALAGVNTPDTEQADNDLAVGRLVAAVAHSPYANNTLIIVTEDDSQDGPDHVDSHRAPIYVVGAYVKKHAVINTRYNQVSVLSTIEDILGAPHINLNTAYQPPMADLFDVTSNGNWTYNAVASTILRTTSLALADTGVKFAEGPDILPRHDAAYWAKATRGFDFSGEDRVPFDLMNQVLWDGTMGGKPYPTHRSGVKLGSVRTTEN
ncbi:beta-propeller fold lactonase family protein [Rhodopila sp.]|uniref:bifunctional YncE family protein/alkaline phosphatase family protein n=1 Tax=Rhodopila sp. TaxID=2480087 RepID=UPI003D13B010